MLKLTDNAIKQVLDAAEKADAQGMALRVAARYKEDGSIDYAMGFDTPTQEDARSNQGGVEVVVDPTSVELLEECTMDFVELEPGEMQFIFMNPNDPHYVPPKKKKQDK
ncbi:MAG: iron-sulfur cluster assembly accessory protein [Gammaproteobacteria bacterium]|nr:iron-sulfur cluster assembly accessory protein [Gammaproteobacteria bacterium]NIR99099.1 iron-sulfur cluster assembly accessory protein [Gammaproteobacteria bacterium]NIT64731.1 iron-sulfur cluster assembly accessory protein [Gammaproteobacteria bacterium]NIV21689.1 iron-sulfur cluster assembly accessory protein [Gammaproteobacteria bacterium]NIX10560.1 iron-sulfur cluster assembly accessory protein [Gammaproteobacteria bacterium]